MTYVFHVAIILLVAFSIASVSQATTILLNFLLSHLSNGRNENVMFPFVTTVDDGDHFHPVRMGPKLINAERETQ